jgi:hypothetical protein
MFPPPDTLPCAWAILMVGGCKSQAKGSCAQCKLEASWLLPGPPGLAPAIRAAATDRQQLRIHQLP